MLLAALTIALQNQAKTGPAVAEKPAAPSVDRSAEPALKALFAESGSLRGVHIAIDSYAYETEANRYDDDSTWDIWLGDGGRFRIENSSNYWGGGSQFVSDGTSLLSDDMSDDGSIRISNAKKTMHELSENETILYALEGQAGFDALVDKDQPLKFITSGGSEQVIELHSKKLGKIVLHYGGNSALPTEIDMFTAPWWANDPNAPIYERPYNVEKVKIVERGSFNPSLFKVAAPTGKNAVDERAKH